MRRRLWMMVLIAALTLTGVFAASGVAKAYTFDGGTTAQRNAVTAQLNAMIMDYSYLDGLAGGVTIKFQDRSLSPLNGMPGACGWSTIYIANDLPSDLAIQEVIAHEWGHLITYRDTSAERTDWINNYATVNLPPGTPVNPSPYNWYYDTDENFAENFKCAMFPGATSSYTYMYPRDNLRNVPCNKTAEFAFAFMGDRIYTDVAAEDNELQGAVGYLNQEGIMVGTTSTTFSPYNNLLRRHVKIICDRMGLPCSFSENDYTPATRGEVDQAIPNLNWNPYPVTNPTGLITRGQFARLMWRETCDVWAPAWLDQYWQNEY